MDSTAQGALIAAIIAVVLGALGLIGGVTGYVQGSAALRRATLTRQRAAAAEEAALQAKDRAEQAARTAQGVLDRLSGLNGAAGAADLPTGPLVLPHRGASDPVPGAPAVSQPVRSVPDQRAADSLPEQDAESSFFSRPGTVPAERPMQPTVSHSTSSEPEPDPDPLVLPPDPASTGGSDAAAEFVPFGGLTPRATSTGPLAAQGTEEPEPAPPTEANPTAEEPEPRATASSPDEPLPSESPAAAAPAPATTEDALAPDPAVEPGAAEVEPPQRSSTGQVTAGGQAPPPMDWAEALRTGAIPLPARSRGTYAAPSKAKGQPVGPARFEIRAVGRQRYEAVNVGGATAEQASLEGAGDDSHLVRPFDARPKPVVAGDSLAFSVLRVEGRDVSVRINWMLNGDEEQAELPVP